MGMKDRMYKKSPSMSRGDDGEMEVSRKEKSKDHEEKHGGTAGTEEPIPAHVRHAHERHMMHAKHENEHAMHDHHEMGDKSEMHGRHQKEMEDMHARHEKEAPSGESMINKVEEE